MSCFIVSDAHISALAAYALRRSPRTHRTPLEGSGFARYNPATGEDWTPQEIGELLNRANVASWNARYPRDPAEPAFRYSAKAAAQHTDLVVLLKAIACYEYQSCEYEGWQNSDARKLARVLYENAVTELPGYEEAPWGIES